MSGQGAQSRVGLPIISAHAGDVSPNEAWERLENQASAFLVDVRTVPEWTFVGGPDLSSLGKEVLQLSWRLYPAMAVNESFLQQLAEMVPDKDAALYFLCRTGGRSTDAAIAAFSAGWVNSYNIAEGFEGALTPEGQRGNVTGWKASELPWRQN